MTNYKDAIDWLFEQFPAYQKIGQSAYKPDLGNTLSLCNQLNIDYNSLRFIHVAGTNGKGSTSNMIASVFIEKQYKTGLFTSPHILDFRERITVNGIQISEERVIEFCNLIRNTKLEVSPSFFEITWALTLTHFIESNCDICVIETGLGGRLDSTNIISPILSVITNISLDHVAILGNTLGRIAFEKAGIIKPGIPVVIGEALPQTFPVFETKTVETKSPLILAEDFGQSTGFFHRKGTYQWKNERTVRTALQVLNQIGYHFSQADIDNGIARTSQNTGFRGRFEIIAQQPLTIVDVAHNEDGIKQMLKTLKLYQQGTLHIVYGTSSDKDIESILGLFPKDAVFYLTEFNNLRSAKIADLQSVSEKLQLNSFYFHKMNDAVTAAQHSANKSDTILITGSFFLVSDFF